jgi:hypothetical protein
MTSSAWDTVPSRGARILFLVRGHAITLQAPQRTTSDTLLNLLFFHSKRPFQLLTGHANRLVDCISNQPSLEPFFPAVPRICPASFPAHTRDVYRRHVPQLVHAQTTWHQIQICSLVSHATSCSFQSAHTCCFDDCFRLLIYPSLCIGTKGFPTKLGCFGHWHSQPWKLSTRELIVFPTTFLSLAKVHSGK